MTDLRCQISDTQGTETNINNYTTIFCESKHKNGACYLLDLNAGIRIINNKISDILNSPVTADSEYEGSGYFPL